MSDKNNLNDTLMMAMAFILKYHQMNIDAYNHTMNCLFSEQSLKIAPQVLTQMNPVTLWSNMFSDNSFAFNFGNSGSPATEKAILQDVGSYGRQLGKMQDLMADMLPFFKTQAGETIEKSASEFEEMYNKIQQKKSDFKC